MQKKFYCLAASLIFIFQITHAQLIPVDSKVYEEKEILIRNLSISNDPKGLRSITTHFENDLGRTYKYILSGIRLKPRDEDKAVRSLGFLLNSLNKSFVQQKISLYEIPSVLRTYQQVLKAILTSKPLLPLLKPLDPVSSELLASAFSQYAEHKYLEDIAIFKRVASSPEFILQFLESKPGFRFGDSLLLEAVIHDPLQVVSYLGEGGALSARLRGSKHHYIKRVVSLAENKQASELIPFIPQFAVNKYSEQEILESRVAPTKYFQLQVNTLQQSILSGSPASVYLKPLREGIRQKALAFYVNEINNLHDAPQATRFASVKELRPEDIYYVITSCGEELYTSSYLGLYRRLMEHFKNGTADSLFDLVQYDNFRVFMRLAANYNVLNEFLHSLSAERMNIVLKEFIGGINKNKEEALDRAMDIADSFTGLDSARDLSGIVESEIENNLDRSRSGQQYFESRLYEILSEVFNLVNQPGGKSKVWESLGDYEMLRRQALLNSKGEIIQLVLFYGDEDGKASFSNFQRLFVDKSKWELTRNAHWVAIRSVTSPVVIYANLPLDIAERKDLQAQDSLFAFFTQQNIEPTIIVHRGHSYHLNKTLKRIRPSMQLAILGSCGSYNKAISIANISPGIQVIGSKKMGSKSINDPILDVINNALVSGKDLYWPQIWKELDDRFRRDQAAMELFSEYFPPSHNLSLFVLKLFKSVKPGNSPPVILSVSLKNSTN